MKKYKINGKEFTLKKLTWGQFTRFFSLIEKVDVNLESSPLTILGNAIRDNASGIFSEIIFPGQGAEKIDWNDVDYDIVDEVLEDFLHSNPRLRRRLSQLIGSFASMMAAAATTTPKDSSVPGSGTSSSTTSPAEI